MSEPDSTPRRRPPTIDLTAKEVGTEGAGPAPEAAAAAENAAPGNAAGRERRNPRAGPHALGILIGAIAATAAAAGFWAAGFVPARDNSVPAVASAAKPASDEISARLDKIQQELQGPRPDDSLAGRVTAIEAQDKALGESLAALSRRADAVAAAVEEAKAAAQTAVRHADLDTLADRIAALEKAVKSLTADIEQRNANTGASDSAARATVAAEALRAAAERGVSFQAELAAVKSFGADPDAVAALTPFAASGVPSAAALGRELAALTPALQRAADSQMPIGSLLGRLEARAQRLVRITPIDAAAPPAGNDASSLIARINADAGRGDIDAALADLAKLPDAVRAPAETWIKKAQAREAALAASRRITADALGALGKPASQ